MATVKFSAVVSDVRGKIGGNVFARGKNGSYIRSFSMPRNANSQIQQVRRNNFSYYSAKWRSLTVNERRQWVLSAASLPYNNRVGETSFYSGFQQFMRVNLILESAAKDL